MRRAAPPRPRAPRVSPGRGRDRLDLAHLVGEQVELALAVAGRLAEPLGRDPCVAQTLERPRGRRRARRGARRRRTGRGTPSGSPVARSRWAWCWPCTSTSAAPSSASADAVASWPPIRAALLPSAPTVRARMTSPSSAQSAGVGRARRTGPGRAPPWPPRGRARRSLGRRGRATSPTVTIVLPAPVSPVSTFRPGCELEVEIVDDPQPADVQLAEHARSLVPDPDIARRSTRAVVARAGRTSRARAPGSRARPSRRTSRAGRPRRGSAPTPRPAARCSGARRPTGVPLSSPTTSRQTWLPGVEHERPVEHHVRGDRRQHEAVDVGRSRSARAPRRSTRSSRSASRRSPRPRRRS